MAMHYLCVSHRLSQPGRRTKAGEDEGVQRHEKHSHLSASSHQRIIMQIYILKEPLCCLNGCVIGTE